MGCATSSSVSSSPSAIANSYETNEQLIQALQSAGLERCNLLVAIDFTKSNTWSGRHSFHGKSLHYIEEQNRVGEGETKISSFGQALSPSFGRTLTFHGIQPDALAENRRLMSKMNPYQFTLSVVGEPLEAFDEDHIIPTCIFGHARGLNESYVKELVDDKQRHPRYINGVIQAYEQALSVYELSGNTQFAPVIRWAMEHVRQTKEYHILLIIGDGAIDDMEETRKALADACNLPLSVVYVGVGDGSDPGEKDKWYRMRMLDDQPTGAVDNFQSVYLTDMKAQLDQSAHPDLELATAMLMEIPEQYKYFKRVHLI